MTMGRTSESEGVRSAAVNFPQGSQGDDPRNPRTARVSVPLFAGEAARFWAKVEKGPGCWLWTGGTSKGYGRFRVLRDGQWTHRRAHRWAYEALVGPIPTGLVIDHTCHNDDAICPGGQACLHRRCVNPAHLEAVDNEENKWRARGRRWA